MKAVSRTLLVVALAALSTASPSRATGPAAEAKAPDYYPLKVGTKWHYQFESNDGQKAQLTNQIGGVEQIDGRELARLEVYNQGQKSPYTEHLASTEGGVFRVRMSSLDLSPPMCLIRYPLKAGQTWGGVTSVGGRRMTIEAKQGRPEEVRVPAGTFRAIPCTIVVSDGADKAPTTLWFAEGVGIVKQRSENGTQTITLELTKYEPAAK